MAELIQLNQFIQTVDNFKELLQYYCDNFKNNSFEIEINENRERVYKICESVFDQVDENIRNLKLIFDQEKEFVRFFDMVKQNLDNLCSYKNEVIEKMLRLKKSDGNISKEDYLTLKYELDKKREETPEEKKRRENNELLEEIKELWNEMKDQESNGIVQMELRQRLKQLEKKINPKNEKNLTVEDELKLEEWTGKKCGDVLFDSDKDDWSPNTSKFNEKLEGKESLVFLIEAQNGETFGYYLNTEFADKTMRRIGTDKNSFMFNLNCDGRLNESMKFPIRNRDYGYWYCWEPDKYLVKIGDIWLHKETSKTESYCIQDNKNFDYQGIENALCGIKPKNGKICFTPERIFVIQMI